MGILILGALCFAGEVFLVYFLIQLIRDSRRESRRLRAGAGEASHTAQFARFEVAPPVAKAVWSEGQWQIVNVSRSGVTTPRQEGDSRRVRRSA